LACIWDFKNKKSIAQLSNPKSREKRRYSCVAWNPENPTQLAIGVEDDETPVIEIWDLKKGYEPIKELKGHSKGILSLSWCPDDSNLLLSSGKDSQVLIWNPNIEKSKSGELSGKGWMHDVQWSYRPSILSTASMEGEIVIHSLQDSSSTLSNTENFPINNQKSQKDDFKTAPKWLKRPCGATFGFGGKLVYFNNLSKNVKVRIFLNKMTNISTDSEFVKQTEDFEKATNMEELKNYILNKNEKTENEEEKLIWTTFYCSLERETKFGELLKVLGYEKNNILNEINEKIEKKEEFVDEENKQKEVVKAPKDINELIQKSLMIANFETAVELCILADRMVNNINHS
jgi:protein transport protein SEC31